jgi:hypothetical protein
MPGTNQFLPFAIGGSANTLTPTAYAALATVVANGFQPGVASSQQANTVWRQATFVAAAVAQLIANQNVNANDDGNLTNFVSNLQVAIANLGSLQAASLITLTANTTLTASQIGSTILGNSTATISATLPAANSVAAGKQVEFRNINTGTFNILRFGSDTITVNAGTTTSQVLLLGDYLLLESNGSNSWYAVNGTILLPTSSTMLANFATLVSPALTGLPTAPTPALGDNTTKLATTAFVKNAIQGLGFGGTTWNNVTGSRGFNTTYTNPYSYPIAVSATATCAVTSVIYAYVNGNLVSFFQWQYNGCGSFGGAFIIVPPGASYSLNSSQGVYNWTELY